MIKPTKVYVHSDLPIFDLYDAEELRRLGVAGEIRLATSADLVHLCDALRRRNYMKRIRHRRHSLVEVADGIFRWDRIEKAYTPVRDLADIEVELPRVLHVHGCVRLYDDPAQT